MNVSFDQLIGAATVGAAWGALVLALYTWYQSRPVRRVEASFFYPVGPAEDYPTLIGITFINEQGPVMVINGVGFECADGRHIPKVRYMPNYGDDILPKEVPPGHSANYVFMLEALRRAVVEDGVILVRAYCRDATDRRHKCPLSQEIRSALAE